MPLHNDMNAKQIVDLMMQKDAFSNWLGIDVLALNPGECVLKMTVNENMVNGFNIAHGGITYSFADSAMAFAANAHGNICVSIDSQISHFKKVELGDVLTAKCTELNRSNTIGVYLVNIYNAQNLRVAHFKGTVKISSTSWSNK